MQPGQSRFECGVELRYVMGPELAEIAHIGI